MNETMQGLFYYLQQISPLKAETLEALRPLFKRLELPTQAYFAKAGEYSKQIGYLESGIVRAFFMNEEGKEYNKQFFMAPTLVGAYTSLLTGQPNQVAQQALSDSVVWTASFDRITALYDHHHDLERLGRKIAEAYFLEKEKKELEMGLLEAEQRYKIMQDEFPMLEVQIPQYHIASYLGITPTQLSRVRKKMAGR